MATPVARMHAGSAASIASPASAFGLSVTLVAAFSTLFMLEAVRVFMAYLVFVVDQSRRVELGRDAILVFGAIALGGVLGRLIGPRATVALCVLGLTAARLTVQFVNDPNVRVICGAIVVMTWGWLLPNLRALSPDDTARGTVYGLLLDLIIRIGFGTIDLPWMPNALRNTFTFVIALSLLAVLPRVLWGTRPPIAAGGGAALIGVGPGLVLFLLLTGNTGMLQARSDLNIQFTLLLAAIGLAAGFAMQIRRPDERPDRREVSSLAIAITLTLLAEGALIVFWRWDGVADVLLVVAAGIASQLLVICVRGRSVAEPAASPLADGLWLTGGMLLLAAIVFLYFAKTGMPLLNFVALALLGVGTALAAKRRETLPALAGGRFLPGMAAAAAACLLLALLVNRAAWKEVQRNDDLPATITAMTYNIQSGFSRDNVWSLENTARVIEDQGADVVILEEVSRGWLVSSGVDEASWLSRRLHMNLAWGPSSNDGLWGVAILSKGRIITTERYEYTSTVNLKRGVLGAAISTAKGPIYVYATHLDNPSNAAHVRLEQTNELLTLTNTKNPAIVGGDFNANPDSDVVAAMTAAGFTDSGVALPPGTGTSEGNNRIDYLFVRGAFQVGAVTAPDVWASDHRPFVAKLTLT